MNYLDFYSSYPDHTIAALSDYQIKEANSIPWIAEASQRFRYVSLWRDAAVQVADPEEFKAVAEVHNCKL